MPKLIKNNNGNSFNYLLSKKEVLLIHEVLHSDKQTDAFKAIGVSKSWGDKMLTRLYDIGVLKKIVAIPGPNYDEAMSIYRDSLLNKDEQNENSPGERI